MSDRRAKLPLPTRWHVAAGRNLEEESSQADPMPSRLTSPPESRRHACSWSKTTPRSGWGCSNCSAAGASRSKSPATAQEALEKVDARPPDDRPERPRDAAEWADSTCCGAAEQDDTGHHGRAHDGAGHGRDRRRGDQAGRLRLPHQAGRSAAAADPARSDRRAARARCARCAALRRQLQERGTFGRMIGGSLEMRKIYQVIEQAAPTAASVLDQRRVGHRQGTGRADDSPAQPARVAAVRAAQLRGDSRHAARDRSCSATRRARSPARSRGARALRAGQPRHAVSRRNRRDDAGHAGQAAARAAGAVVPAARRPRASSRWTSA